MDLPGVYYDPNHGGCVRVVSHVRGDVYEVTGAYGDGEMRAAGTPWKARIHVTGDKFLTVDFYGKHTTHDRIYRALWCPTVRRISWEDGNAWTKLHSPY